MWVPASSACNQINIDVDTGKTTPRSWTISVLKHESIKSNAEIGLRLLKSFAFPLLPIALPLRQNPGFILTKSSGTLSK